MDFFQATFIKVGGKMKTIELNDFKRIGQTQIYVYQTNRLCSNRYLLLDKDAGILMIDSGDGEDKLDFKPTLCLLTHGHFDHTSGVESDWKVYISDKEDPALPYINIPKNAKKFENNLIKFGRFLIEIIPTPGHTPGSVCFFEKNNKVLFSGDTLFANGAYGRTDLGGSDIEIRKSLKKLLSLNYILLCPGHGEIEQRR
mgnify:CR=1 FL=1